MKLLYFLASANKFYKKNNTVLFSYIIKGFSTYSFIVRLVVNYVVDYYIIRARESLIACLFFMRCTMYTLHQNIPFYVLFPFICIKHRTVLFEDFYDFFLILSLIIPTALMNI